VEASPAPSVLVCVCVDVARVSSGHHVTRDEAASVCVCVCMSHSAAEPQVG